MSTQHTGSSHFRMVVLNGERAQRVTDVQAVEANLHLAQLKLSYTLIAAYYCEQLGWLSSGLIVTCLGDKPFGDFSGIRDRNVFIAFADW